MLQESRDHLASAGESYTEHCRFALRYAAGCFQAGFMALIHAFVPAMFMTGASQKIKDLAGRRRPSEQSS